MATGTNMYIKYTHKNIGPRVVGLGYVFTESKTRDVDYRNIAAFRSRSFLGVVCQQSTHPAHGVVTSLPVTMWS